MLTRRLRKLVPLVVGIDSDQVRIELARSLDGTGSIAYMLGDFMDCTFPPASFDLITSIATLQHMPGLGAHPDARATHTRRHAGHHRRDPQRHHRSGPQRHHRPALRACPGYRHPAAHPPQGLLEPSVPDGLAAPAELPPDAAHRRRRLPSVQYRRHVLWRYSLRWTKPARSCCELTMRWVGVSARGLRRFPCGAAVRHRSGWRGPRPRRCGRW
jgi:Methyltransferase domain